MAVAYVALFVFFLASGAKAYYIAPMYSVLIPAGSIWWESLGRSTRLWTAGAAAIGLGVGAFIALPLDAPGSVDAFDLTGELGETVGWPTLVAEIAAVERRLGNDAVVFAGSYGEAGAVDVLGPPAGLVGGAWSGDNSYWWWGPPPPHGPVIGVGGVRDVMRLICDEPEEVATISNPWNVDNEESGQPILVCAEPVRQLADVWKEVRHYN